MPEVLFCVIQVYGLLLGLLARELASPPLLKARAEPLMEELPAALIQEPNEPLSPPARAPRCRAAKGSRRFNGAASCASGNKARLKLPEGAGAASLFLSPPARRPRRNESEGASRRETSRPTPRQPEEEERARPVPRPASPRASRPQSRVPGTAKMRRRAAGLLLGSFLLCAALPETFGLALPAKDKRGWTMNSAGYLLGPRDLLHEVKLTWRFSTSLL
ncbi:UNVERIFIED_CONTAM: hypothetical protein K2H54_064048 [Gekko kuhli]